jgi:alpha-mannosidase
VQFGAVSKRPDGNEEPGQGWVDVSGGHRSRGIVYGLAQINQGKHSFDVRGSELGLTVLRSPAYAHHDPHRPDSWDDLEFMDLGPHHFQYALLPHPGWPLEARLSHRAAEFNQPPVALVHTFHPGTLARAASFAEIRPDNLLISAIKLAEDGSGDLVVRCYEAAGRPAAGLIRLPAWRREIETSFGAVEIKTFRVPARADHPVAEVSLLEWP